ncbi:MAG: ThiF family adenylyltransferase [Gemmataceae bacterium]
MAQLIQVGAGSGGMPVLDMLCRDARITRVTLIEPDEYQAHNAIRHPFPRSAIGTLKADGAARWLKERRPNLDVRLLTCDLLDPARQAEIEAACADAAIGVCAADNEAAKYAFDVLMRRHRVPWTLGEVLSGGIGGFVHWFVPGGPCYGCVASFLQRSLKVEQEKTPDYAQPGGPVETTIPAGIASIGVIASLHALITLELLEDPAGYQPGFNSLLFTLKRVPDVFDEAFRPHRFRIARAATCLICSKDAGAGDSSEDLDEALDQALARLGNG